MPFDAELLVVSFGSADVITRLLSSVQALAPTIAVAVQEHGDDAAFARLTDTTSSFPGQIRLQHDPSNPGFGAGCNALASTSTATWYAFVNPDTEIVAWPWSDHHAPPADAIIGPQFTDTRRASDHSGRTYRVRDEVGRSWLRSNGPTPDGSGFVSGAALLVERAAFRRIGGFDERYFLFYEDIDLCLRANDLGIRTIIDDTWIMRHARGHSTSAHFGSSLIWSYESAIHFHRTHHHALRTYRWYVLADALARAALHGVRRDSVRRRGYLHLAGRAARELTAG